MRVQIDGIELAKTNYSTHSVSVAQCRAYPQLYDGLQINCLVLSVFINLFPDMVKQGRVFISMPPLYCWGDSPKNYGWCNKIEDIPKSAKNVHRFKGLGEMNNDQLEYFLVNPETRNLLQIEFPSDINEFNKILGTSAGKNELLKMLGIVEEGY